MISYKPENYNYKDIYTLIASDWVKWAADTNTKKFVIGISGGKDSTCCAALAREIFGKENVIGVSMPNGATQEDIEDVEAIINQLEIESLTIHIDSAFLSIYEPIAEYYDSIDNQAIINLPARLRMASLFAVAQTVDGKVINTCNLSENFIGYSTLFGDDCGAYSPLGNLTCTEVKYLNKWLGICSELAFKEPADGLCGKTDEDNLGFTYLELDRFIRTGYWNNYQSYRKIMNLHKKNAFKKEIIHLPAPEVGLPVQVGLSVRGENEIIGK